MAFRVLDPSESAVRLVITVSISDVALRQRGSSVGEVTACTYTMSTCKPRIASKELFREAYSKYVP